MSISPSHPHLAIALGDPAGIGPEVVLKALADAQVTADCRITLVGRLELWEQALETIQRRAAATPLADLHQFELWDIPACAELVEQVIPGVGNAASGEISFRVLDQAVSGCLSGIFDGVVTAPIAKSAWKAAGHRYPGQTELLAERAGVEQFGMLFVARSPHTGWVLRTLLATTHIPLRAVPTALTPDLMTLKLELLIPCLQQDFGLEHPRIAIAGLNPHSGEAGQLGREEVDWLVPWLQQMRDRHPQLQLDGPVPPDTLWVAPGQAWFGYPSRVTPHDAYLALYHDQGLIPVKLMAFDRAVNTTIGLPFVRTSPDHGTAFDIAGQGIADASSMKHAIQTAKELARQRLQYTTLR